MCHHEATIRQSLVPSTGVNRCLPAKARLLLIFRSLRHQLTHLGAAAAEEASYGGDGAVLDARQQKGPRGAAGSVGVQKQQPAAHPRHARDRAIGDQDRAGADPNANGQVQEPQDAEYDEQLPLFWDGFG